MKHWLALIFLSLTSVAPPPIAAQTPPPKIEQPPIINIPPPLPVNMPNIYASDELGAQQYGVRMITDQCLSQSPIFWCKGQGDYDAIKKAKPLDAYDIAHVTRNVHHLFHYKSDDVDSWRVHTWEVKNNMIWYGDCDDLASTTLDELIREGSPLDHIWLLLVSTENTNDLDHLIAMVEDKDGHYWIVGDTWFPSLYPVSEIKHRVIAVARGDDMLAWKSPEALGIFDPMQMVRVIPDKVEVHVPKTIPLQTIDLKRPLIPLKGH